MSNLHLFCKDTSNFHLLKTCEMVDLAEFLLNPSPFVGSSLFLCCNVSFTIVPAFVVRTITDASLLGGIVFLYATVKIGSSAWNVTFSWVLESFKSFMATSSSRPSTTASA